MAEKKPSFWERYALRELSVDHQTQENEDLFLLSEDEVKKLKKLRRNTYLKTASAGALGVIILYVPYHAWGHILFPETDFWIPYLNEYIPIEIEFLIYSLVLVLLEIWFLTYVNIKAVAGISNICGSSNPSDPQYENNVNALIAVGLEKKQKKLESIGINPYEGLNKYAVLAFQLLLRLKAAATGFLFKLLIKKALGRYAFRVLVDLAGIPVYAFWNSWGARKIMNETRVRVMAPPLIRKMADTLHTEQKENPEFKKHIYDTLQAVSTSKRSFHYNHFLLAVTMMEKFDVPLEDDYDEDFIEKVGEFNLDTRNGIAKLLVFGIMLDGVLSRREKKALQELIDQGVLPYSIDQVDQWSKDYFAGRGLEKFFTF